MSRCLLFFALIAAWQPVYSQENALDILNGKFLYEEYAGCASCHGMDGNGQVEDLGFEDPLPDFTDCSFTTREPRKDWRDVIKQGGPARGLSESMPAYGEAISDQQVEALIDYIKTFCSEPGWPPGDLNFRRPLVTGKAFPENEAVLNTSYANDENETSVTKFVYERRLGKRTQWEVAVPFIAELNASETGFGDVELSLKHVLWDHLPSASILSGGLEVVTPTGETGIGIGSGTWKVAPFFAAAKGFGSFFIQTNLKYEAALEGDERELLLNLAFTQALTKEKKGAFPMLEVNAIQAWPSEKATIMLTPQIYFAFVKRGHVALSVGSQIPVTNERPFDYRIMTFLLWEYVDGGLWW